MGSQSVKAIVEKEALKRVDTSVQGLYIFRADLERIHHAVVKGEPLLLSRSRKKEFMEALTNYWGEVVK